MEVFRTILPLFVLILVGYVLRKTSFAQREFVDDLNRLVYFVGLPAMLFTEASTMEFAELSGATVAVAYPVIVAATALIGLVVMLPLAPYKRGAVVQAGFRGNLAYLGIPIVGTTLGPGSYGPIAAIIAIGVVINTLTSVSVLGMLQPNSRRSSVKGRLLGIVKNPLLIAIAGGLMLSAAELTLPQLLAQSIELLARMSLPLILLVLGMSLSFSALRGHVCAAAAAAALKLLVMPAVAWFLMNWVFGATALVAHTVTLMAGLPSAVVSQAFAKAFDADAALSASSVSLSTLLSAVTVPLIVLILGV